MVMMRTNLAQKTFEAPATSLAVVKEIIDELEYARVVSKDTDLVIEHELSFLVRIAAELEHIQLLPIERVRRSLIEISAAAINAVEAIDRQESES